MKRSGLTSVLVIGLALAAVGSFATPVAVAQDAPKQAKAKAGPKTAAAAKGNCVTKYGRGWAFSLDGAKFQAWEIVAQTTGNWPFQTDVFKNEKYTCKPEGSQIRCDSRIDVCSQT